MRKTAQKNSQPQVPAAPPPTPSIPSPKPIDRPSIIDEYGRITTKLQNMSALVRRQEQLRSMILGWYKSHDPAAAIDEDGEQYSIHVSPCALERRIVDLAGIEQRVGLERFLGMCSVTLAKLDAVLPKQEQAKFLREERIGPRTMKPIQKFTTA